MCFKNNVQVIHGGACLQPITVEAEAGEFMFRDRVGYTVGSWLKNKQVKMRRNVQYGFKRLCVSSTVLKFYKCYLS